MQNNSVNMMVNEIIDSLIKHIGKGATDFQVKGVNEDPNQKTFIVEFKVYEFYWVGIDYEKGRVTPYIVEGMHIIRLKNITNWWEEMTLDLWVDELATELKLRIPDKYLKIKAGHKIT